MFFTLALTSGSLAQTSVAPFGLTPGMSLVDLLRLGAVQTDSIGIYTMRNVPVPNAAFDTYFIKASKTYGLCKIAASTKLNTNDNYGINTKSIFKTLKDILLQKYGKSIDYDYIGYNSIWKKPEDWLYSIKVEDRILDSFWSLNLVTASPYKLNTIGLETNSLDRSNGWVILSYEFSNLALCDKENKDSSGNGL